MTKQLAGTGFPLGRSRQKGVKRGGARPGAGRPKGSGLQRPDWNPTQGLAALARTYTKEALDIIVSIAKDTTVPAMARVSAAAHILDRGHGKPPVAVQISGDPNNPVVVQQQLTAEVLAKLSPEQLEVLEGVYQVIEDHATPELAAPVDQSHDPGGTGEAGAQPVPGGLRQKRVA